MAVEDIYFYMCKVSNKLLSRIIKPDKKYNDIKEIDIEEIKNWKKKYGIGGIILDVDGTLKKNNKIDMNYNNFKWLEELGKEFKICILSNNVENKKIMQLSKALKLKYFSFALKPLKKSFILAANEMGLNPENVLVIGDDYFADIIGGQNAGMHSVVIQENDDEKER